MKKVAILAIIAAGLVLAGCASKTATDQTTVAPATTHHDYKGEVAKK